MTGGPRSYSTSISIIAAPTRVMWAFFDAGALASWWQAARSVTIPRVLGPYAVEWEPTDFKDDVLGRLGGIFHGTVMEYKADKEFFVADAYWLPPDGDPIGPMAFEVSCTTLGERMVLRVRQSGGEPNRRWTRYYEVLASRLTASMDELKQFVESGA